MARTRVSQGKGNSTARCSIARASLCQAKGKGVPWQGLGCSMARARVFHGKG